MVAKSVSNSQTKFIYHCSQNVPFFDIVLQNSLLYNDNVITGLNGVLVSPAVFKTVRDLRARFAGFDSQAVPPILDRQWFMRSYVKVKLLVKNWK